MHKNVVVENKRDNGLGVFNKQNKEYDFENNIFLLKSINFKYILILYLQKLKICHFKELFYGIWC